MAHRNAGLSRSPVSSSSVRWRPAGRSPRWHAASASPGRRSSDGSAATGRRAKPALRTAAPPRMVILGTLKRSWSDPFVRCAGDGAPGRTASAGRWGAPAPPSMRCSGARASIVSTACTASPARNVRYEHTAPGDLATPGREESGARTRRRRQAFRSWLRGDAFRAALEAAATSPPLPNVGEEGIDVRDLAFPDRLWKAEPAADAPELRQRPSVTLDHAPSLALGLDRAQVGGDTPVDLSHVAVPPPGSVEAHDSLCAAMKATR